MDVNSDLSRVILVGTGDDVEAVYLEGRRADVVFAGMYAYVGTIVEETAQAVTIDGGIVFSGAASARHRVMRSGISGIVRGIRDER